MDPVKCVLIFKRLTFEIEEPVKMCQRKCLYVAKIHLYCWGAVGDKRGVYSYIVLDAEFDSGVKIRILLLFDPQNPLFRSKISLLYFPETRASNTSF